MSDHPKEAERNLKRIFICDDIYFDVFRLLRPAKVGLELALVSDRFDALVDTHFKYRKWTLSKLDIWSKDIVKTNDDGSKETLSFPQTPLPNSIVGFAYVNICSFDAIVFLQCISRLLVSNVCLKLHLNVKSNLNIFATSAWPLLNVSAIIKMHFIFSTDFHLLRRLISPSILCDCTNLRVITFGYGSVIQFPPDDTKGSFDGQVLCKWLHKPREDGQPKVFKCWWDCDFPLDALKATFLNATTSVNFIIHLFSNNNNSHSQFELVNSLTHEQLTSRRIKYGDDDCWLIGRSPINKSAKKWAEWEKEALKHVVNDWNVIRMCL